MQIVIGRKEIQYRNNLDNQNPPPQKYIIVNQAQADAYRRLINEDIRRYG